MALIENCPLSEDPRKLNTKSLERQIKLIWDFRGPTAQKTAEHHKRHLAEFIVVENLSLNITGTEYFGEVHSMAYLVVMESEMKMVRDRLKPHRGEVYTST